ncbi:MAG: hypothetical protein DCC68_06005 [Planctomycetota bacterium]|nr:MAG: hypothetical protein DCC68_06005 [Planctomycetota bacterium]
MSERYYFLPEYGISAQEIPGVQVVSRFAPPEPGIRIEPTIDFGVAEDTFSRKAWIRETLQTAVARLADAVTVNHDICGGVPVVRGTRMPVSTVLAELADDLCLSDISDDFDIEKEKLVSLLGALSLAFNRDFSRDRLPAR